MIYLKQSTASQEVPLGHFVDDSDGKTAETGLTISNTDIKIWKTGATSLADKNSGGATHMAGGVYYAVLDATDTNTLGPLTIFVHESGALPVKVDCCVLAANVYDSLIGNSDKLQVDSTQISGSSTAADNAEIVYDTDFATNYSTANDKWQTEADVTKVDGSALETASAGYFPADVRRVVGTSSPLANFTDMYDGTGYAGGTIKLDVNTTTIEGSDATDQINAACDTALTDYDPPTATEMTSAFTEIKGATWDTTDTLEAIRDRGDAAWTTATGFSTHSAADVWGVATRTLTADTNINYPSAADIRSEIDSNSTQLNAIVADTNELQTNQDNWLTATGFSTHSDADVVTAMQAVADDFKADVSGIPTATENADALLNRDMSAVSDTNARSPLNALRHIRNKWAISSSTLTVYKEDDTTSAWTSSMSTATADPITGSDPA
jgi:hypothetical protein